MVAKTLRDLLPGVSIQDTDIFLSRQGTDAEDKKITSIQIKDYVLNNVNIINFGLTEAKIEYNADLILKSDVSGNGKIRLESDTILPSKTNSIGIGTSTPTAGLEIVTNGGGSFVGGYNSAMALIVDTSASWNLVYGNNSINPNYWIANYVAGNSNLYFGDSYNYGILQIKPTKNGTQQSAVGINTTDLNSRSAKRDLDVYSYNQNGFAIVNITGKRQNSGVTGEQTGQINFNVNSFLGVDFSTSKIESYIDTTGGNGGYLSFKTGINGDNEAFIIQSDGKTVNNFAVVKNQYTVTKTIDTNLTTYNITTEGALRVTATATVFLPTNPQDGQEHEVLNDIVGGGTVTVDGNGINIEGNTSVTLTLRYENEKYRYYAGANEWIVV